MTEHFEVEKIDRMNGEEVYVQIVSEDGSTYKGILTEAEIWKNQFWRKVYYGKVYNEPLAEEITENIPAYYQIMTKIIKQMKI